MRDGNALTAKAGSQLDYVSKLAEQLGVKDPVATYLEPVVGRWSDLHDEATRWRTAAKAAEDVTHRLTAPLGGLDAAWQGKDADSFLDYMRQVGLAGNDMSDAMNAMADALDKTADSLRQIAQEMVDLLSDTADDASDAMAVPVTGPAKVKDHLEELDEPTGQLHESARDVLAAFTKLCHGVQGGQPFAGVTMSHKMPDRNWSPSPGTPQHHAPTHAPGRAPTPTSTPSPTSTSAPTQTSASTQTPAPTQTSAPPQTPATGPAAVPGQAPAAGPTAVPGQAAGPVPAAQTPAAAHTTAAVHPAGTGSPHVSMPAASGGTSPVVGHAATAGSVGGESGPPAMSAAAMSDPTTGSISGQLPTTGGTAAADSSQQQSGMPMGMSGMGGMRGGQGGGDQEHKAKTRVSGDVRDIFGKPDRTAPPTIGDK